MDHGIMLMLQMQSSSDCRPPNKDGVVSVLNDPFGSHRTALLELKSLRPEDFTKIIHSRNRGRP